MKTDSINIFYLKKKVLFPHCTMTVRMRESKHTLALSPGSKILIFSLRNFFDFFLIKKRISILAEITGIEKDKNHLKIQLKGIKRVKVTHFYRFFEARFIDIPEDTSHQDILITKDLRKKAQELIFLINVEESDRLIELMNFLVDLGQITDFISNYFILDDRMRNDLLNTTDISERSRLLQKKIQLIINKFGKQG